MWPRVARASYARRCAKRCRCSPPTAARPDIERAALYRTGEGSTRRSVSGPQSAVGRAGRTSGLWLHGARRARRLFHHIDALTSGRYYPGFEAAGRRLGKLAPDGGDPIGEPPCRIETRSWLSAALCRPRRGDGVDLRLRAAARDPLRRAQPHAGPARRPRPHGDRHARPRGQAAARDAARDRRADPRLGGRLESRPTNSEAKPSGQRVAGGSALLRRCRTRALSPVIGMRSRAQPGGERHDRPDS